MSMLMTFRTGLAAAASAVLLACSGHPEDKAKADGQLVATVNGHEISVHQLNAASAPLPAGTPPDKLHAAARATLDRLIDQQLFVEKAIERKLDREPKVVLQIEAAKQQILARACADSLAQGVTEATTAEAQAFYDKHPELFAARRIYRLQEFQLARNPGPEVVKNLLDGARTMTDVAHKLAAEKLGFNETTVTVLPEQVPMSLATELAGVKVGGLIVVPQQNGSVGIAQVLAAQDAPVQSDKALVAVQRFLARQRQSEAVANELKSLKDKAKIVYLGDFDPKAVAERKPVPDAPPPPSGALTVDPASVGKGTQGTITVNPDALPSGAGGVLTAPGAQELKK